MPIILYQNPDSPPCMSVRILAKTIGIELQLKEVAYDGEMYMEPYRKVNPAHTVPALDDNGFRIWESRAIMGYLVQQYAQDDQLYPKDAKKRAKVDNMLHFDVGNRYASFVEYFYPPALFGHDGVLEAKDKVRDRLSILDTILSEQPYVAGHSLSLADISVRCSLIAPIACGYGNYNEHPNITKWMDTFDKEMSAFNDIARDGLKLMADWYNEGLKKHGIDPSMFHHK